MALHTLLSQTLFRSTSLPSSLTQSIHRFLGCPLPLVLTSPHPAAHLYGNAFSSHMFMCPYHLVCFPFLSWFHDLQFLSYIFVSNSVPSSHSSDCSQTLHLSHFQLFHMFFHCPCLCLVQSLTMVLYTCAFNIIDIRLSWITQLTLLHAFPIPRSHASTLVTNFLGI